MVDLWTVLGITTAILLFVALLRLRVQRAASKTLEIFWIGQHQRPGQVNSNGRVYPPVGVVPQFTYHHSISEDETPDTISYYIRPPRELEAHGICIRCGTHFQARVPSDRCSTCIVRELTEAPLPAQGACELGVESPVEPPEPPPRTWHQRLLDDE